MLDGLYKGHSISHSMLSTSKFIIVQIPCFQRAHGTGRFGAPQKASLPKPGICRSIIPRLISLWPNFEELGLRRCWSL